MSYTEIAQRNAKEIRQRLRRPSNAVKDPGINLSRKPNGYRGKRPPDLDIPKPKVIFVAPPIRIPPHQPIVFPLTFQDILAEVAKFYGIPLEVLAGDCRKQKTHDARCVALYIGTRLLRKKSIPAMARDLDRDPSTMHHAKKKITKQLLEDGQLLNEINILEDRLCALDRC